MRGSRWARRWAASRRANRKAATVRPCSARLEPLEARVVLSTVSGTVFNDLDGDGVQNGRAEAGLSGWRVYADLNGNGAYDSTGTPEPSDLTSITGDYTITGLLARSYTIRVALNSGYVATVPATGSAGVNLTFLPNATDVNFGVARAASISGYVFDDSNSNGVLDPAGGSFPFTYPAERMLSGWTIFIDLNRDFRPDLGEPSAVSDSNGAFTLSGLKPGDYQVREVQQTGWDQFAPAGGVIPVSLSGGEQYTGAAFGNAQPLSVSGAIYNDLNGDGNRDVGEGPLFGWNLFVDYNGNGSQDAGEPSTATDLFGHYTFVDLPPKDGGPYPGFQVHSVVITPASGWTSDSTDLIGVPAHEGIAFVIDRGYYQPAQVSGVVFRDVNGNGAQDAGEPGIYGTKVRLNSTIQATTAADGSYTIAARPGSHMVSLVDEFGYVQTSPSTAVYPIAPASNQVLAGKNFGLIHPAYVRGAVFNDLNADGIQNGTEGPATGWHVLLDTNSNGAADPKGSVTTLTGSGFVLQATTTTVLGQTITVPGAVDLPLQVVAPGTSARIAHVTVAASADDLDSLTFSLVTPDDREVPLGDLPSGGTSATATFDLSSIEGTTSQGTWKLRVRNYNKLTAGQVTAWSMKLDLQEMVASGDASGRYDLNPLLPGSYLVKLLPPAEFRQTKPVADIPYVLNNLTENQVVDSRDFGMHDYVPPAVLSAVFDPNGAQQLSVTFSEFIRASLDGTELKVFDSTGASVPLFYQGDVGDLATWRPALGTRFADGNYRAVLEAASIQDVSGNRLDGNADGTGGDDYSFGFFQLTGDANRDRTVDREDLKTVLRNIGKVGQHWADGDFNADGKVNFLDYQRLELAFRHSLPAPAPAPSLAPVASTLQAEAEARQLLQKAPAPATRPPAPPKVRKR